MIYFDNAAYHPVAPDVIQKTTELMRILANPSSLHKAGARMKKEIEEARMKVANAIKCDPKEIIFTSGATESNAMIVTLPESTYISEFEHSSMRYDHVTRCTDNEMEQYNEYYSHILVDSETGTNFTNLFKNLEGRILVSDITAALGNIPVNVKNLGLKAASLSGEKFGGLSGTGALYVTSDISEDIIPCIEGSQEKGFRGGTENIIGIVAMGVAIEHATENLIYKNAHCRGLKDTLLQELRKYGFDFIINGENQIPAICSVSFKRIEGAALANYLDANNICVSTGSACNSGSMEPSKVLKAFHVPGEYVNGTIRFSFNTNNTTSEIKFAVSKIAEFIERVKE